MQERDRRTVTPVLGGVRSGKSRLAQEVARRFSRVGFIATAKPSDAEMIEKIRRHRAERPTHWQTIEEPLELARVLAEHASKFDMLVVDCLTIFVANLLEATETSPASADPASIELHIESFLETLRRVPASVVLVSNEVGSGVVPPYPAGRRFRDALGELNQRVAAIADNTVLMVAGLPLALKGTVGTRLGAQI